MKTWRYIPATNLCDPPGSALSLISSQYSFSNSLQIAGVTQTCINMSLKHFITLKKQKVQLWPVLGSHSFRFCLIRCETTILVHEVWQQYALTAKVLTQVRYILLKPIYHHQSITSLTHAHFLKYHTK